LPGWMKRSSMSWLRHHAVKVTPVGARPLSQRIARPAEIDRVTRPLENRICTVK